MSYISDSLTAEKIRIFFLYVLFLSIPFSIAGDDFSIIGLYLCTIYLFAKGKGQWISTKIQYAIAIFFLGVLISTLTANDIVAGFKYYRAFWRFGLPFLIFFTLKEKSVYPFLKATAVISSIVAVYAIVQYFTGLDILRSTDLHQKYQPNVQMWQAVGAFSHHLTYGGVSLVLFALFTPMAVNKTHTWRQRSLFALGSLLNLAALIFSLGRSIWLGAIGVICILVLLRIRLKVVMTLIILAAVGVGVYTQIDQAVKDEFYSKSTIGRRIDSFNINDNIDRILMWEAAVAIIKDHPVLGVGPNNSDDMQPYYDRLAQQKNHRFQHKASVGVHNIYLQTWINFGLIGIIGYLAWWLVLLFEILLVLKKKTNGPDIADPLLSGLFAGFIGIMIAGFFENNFRDGEVQTTIFMAMGLALVSIHQKKFRLSQNE